MSHPPACPLLSRLLLPLWFLLAATTSAAQDAAPATAPPTAGSVSFINDVVPLLTRHGCNAGACHAKAGNGQNGFQLSLLGFEPAEDYEHLVKEARGRRLFAAVPENSLLLLK
ncbi:MAG: S-layer protein, partial [Planctomycetaceae bacterium]